MSLKSSWCERVLNANIKQVKIIYREENDVAVMEDRLRDGKRGKVDASICWSWLHMSRHRMAGNGC